MSKRAYKSLHLKHCPHCQGPLIALELDPEEIDYTEDHPFKTGFQCVACDVKLFRDSKLTWTQPTLSTPIFINDDIRSEENEVKIKIAPGFRKVAKT